MEEGDSNIMLKAAIIVIAIVAVILGTVFFAYPEQTGAAVETITKPISEAIGNPVPTTTPKFILHGTEKPTVNPTPSEAATMTVNPSPTPTRRRIVWFGTGITPKTDLGEYPECLECLLDKNMVEFKVGIAVNQSGIKNCQPYLPELPDYWKRQGLWICFKEDTVTIRQQCGQCPEDLSEVVG